MDDEQRALKQGMQVGPWTIGSLIGEGAFAQVYAVTSNEGEAALKLLVAEGAQARKRFEREIKVLQSLPQSPFVVSYRDDGQLEDTAGPGRWVAMERIHGVPLSHLLTPGRPVEPRTAARLVLQLCEALEGLHELGLSHGDLKPANIMIPDDRESARLLDFGLVRDAQGLLKVLQREDIWSGSEFEEELDSTMLMGTPQYMAPEQMADARRQSSHQTDTYSDVFGLGVIVYQLLAGRCPFPFEPTSQRTFKKDLHRYLEWRATLTDEQLPPIDAVPEELETIVRKALRQNPRQRQHDAKALAQDLRRYLETGAGIEAADEADDTIAMGAEENAAVMARLMARLEAERDEPPAQPPPEPAAAPSSLLEQHARSDNWRAVVAGAFAVGSVVGIALYWILGR